MRVADGGWCFIYVSISSIPSLNTCVLIISLSTYFVCTSPVLWLYALLNLLFVLSYPISSFDVISHYNFLNKHFYHILDLQYILHSYEIIRSVLNYKKTKLITILTIICFLWTCRPSPITKKNYSFYQCRGICFIPFVWYSPIPLLKHPLW